MNTHSVNDDETDIDDLETLTTSHTSLIAVNNALIITNQNNIATHESEINALQTLTNTHESEINALQSNELFTDIIKFTINGSYAYSAGGGNSGSAQSTTLPLTTTPRRFILVSTDTYSSNITLSDNNTTFRPNESGTYLSIISAEFYDNSADTKLAQLELIEKMGSSESSRQIIRNNFTGSSTSFEYGRLNHTAIVTLNSGKDYWYKAIGSANGGIINSFSSSTGFTLIKINKSF